jgi:thiamine-monophosphate kinase
VTSAEYEELMPLRLDEVGERRLIDEVFRPRYGARVANFGDDTAVIPSREGMRTIVATVDPCPTPAAQALGFDDPYYHGWLAATISLSDIAAAGAEPLGLLSSLIVPSSLTVRQLVRLLEGLDDAAAEAGTHVVGGNIRDAAGAVIELTTTAFGSSVGAAPLSRVGCAPGDDILAIGELGLFWSQFLAYRAEAVNLPTAVLTPRAQVAAGKLIGVSEIATCCIDNSDGLYACGVLLARANAVEIRFDFSSVRWHQSVIETAGDLGVEPIRLALGWGDWLLVCGCSSAHTSELIDQLGCQGIVAQKIGDVRSGCGVTLTHGGSTARMAPGLDSERLTKRDPGIEAYVDDLLRMPLWVDAVD